MEDKIEETIDTRYKIIMKKGSGGTANAFLVEDKNNNNALYVIKIYKFNKEINKTYYANEVKCLNILKQIHNPYILNIITNGEGPVIRIKKNKGLPLIKKYIVLEYAPNRELADFIIHAERGLKEDKSKALFYKIIKGVESIHEKGICHRDIKLENILLDANFNPKIADFGNAVENASNLNDFFGSYPYFPPEMLEFKPYDGFKADIFSLGVTLMYLTFNNGGFKKANIYDDLYKKIIDGKKDEYFKSLKNKITEEISTEFKDLFFWMVSYNPQKRPTIKEILSHNWFKSYLKMNNEQKKQLDKEIEDDFQNRIQIIAKKIEEEIETAELESESEYESGSLNRGGSGKVTQFFKSGMKPIKAPKGFDTSFSIKIKGLVNPSKFMNKFCHKLGNCQFEADINKLKLTAIFEDDEENLDENFGGNEIIIKFKLYESEEGIFLKLFKVKGSSKNFFDKFIEISKMLKKSN